MQVDGEGTTALLSTPHLAQAAMWVTALAFVACHGCGGHCCITQYKRPFDTS